MSTHFTLRCDTCELSGPDLRRQAGGTVMMSTAGWGASQPAASAEWTAFLVGHEYHRLLLVREGTPLPRRVEPLDGSQPVSVCPTCDGVGTVTGRVPGAGSVADAIRGLARAFDVEESIVAKTVGRTIAAYATAVDPDDLEVSVVANAIGHALDVDPDDHEYNRAARRVLDHLAAHRAEFPPPVPQRALEDAGRQVDHAQRAIKQAVNNIDRMLVSVQYADLDPLETAESLRQVLTLLHGAYGLLDPT